jgi:hypothetical protein
MPKEGELIFSTCRVWIAGLSLGFWPKIKPMNVQNRGKMDTKPMKTLDWGNIKNCYVIYEKTPIELDGRMKEGR